MGLLKHLMISLEPAWRQRLSKLQTSEPVALSKKQAFLTVTTETQLFFLLEAPISGTIQKP